MKKILQLLMLCIFCWNIAKAQTETEPNNVWNQSNLTTIGGTGTGTTASGGDEDWWRVVTPGDGKLTVSWTLTSGILIYCQVYDTLGTILLANNYTGTTATHNIDGLAKGTYYIRFVAYYSTDAPTYSFTPTFTAASVANNIEPDSTVILAKTLPLNVSVTGHIGYYFNNHRDSTDWYKVNVVQDGLLSYTITSENGQNVYAQLFDGDGTSYFVGGYTTSSATYTKDGLAPGTYYIRIFTYFTTEFAPYTLSNTFTPPPSANDPAANETPATASTLPLNGSVTGHIGFHYTTTRDDVDWWKVTVAADGRLDFTITSDNGQNVFAQLYDGDGTTYLAGGYTTTTASYSKDGLAPGAYYIRVVTYYTSEFASYSLSNTLTQPVQANDVGSNDVYTNALAFSINTTKTGHIGYRYNGNIDAIDWYKIVLTGDGKIDFSITSDNGQNVFAQLYDGDGTTYLAGGYTTVTGSYTKDGLAAGTYYIRILTYYVQEFAPYTLSNTVTVLPTPNDVEPNNTSATAGLLNINTTINGHTGYQYNGLRDDIDFYSLTLPVDGKLSFTISNTSGNNANVYAQLYDNNGTTYLVGSYTTTTATYTINNLAAGTYYIRILTYYSTEFSSYSLSNSLEPMNFLAETSGDNSIAARGTLLPANTPTGGHLYFYYNLITDDTDWWKIGYDGNGTMSLGINIEQNHFNTDYPYINYALYLDTLLAPVASGQLHAATNTIPLTGLSIAKYYLKINSAFATFGAYQLNAAYTERCLNVVTINSSTQLAGCNGNITYGITGGLPEYTVQLYKNASPFGPAQVVDNTNTITFSNLGVGTYYARSYSFGGSGSCNNVSGNTTFAIPATPTITAGGATTFCQGGSVTLTSSAATSYLWSTGATTQSIVVTASGNYSVTAYNAAGCASLVSAITSVTVNPLPATPTIGAGSATTFCAGGSVILTSTAATSYLWSSGQTTQSITVNASGNYSVTVKNANNCSSTSAPTTVTVNPLPAVPTINASGPTTFCQGGSVTLTSSSATGNLWSNNATTQSITVNTTGNYSVTVTNANNCTATSSPTSVTVNPLPAVPTINASGPTTFCQGGSVTLTSSSATGNLWSNNATSQSITVNASGNYSVTVTNANNCSSTSALTTVTVNPLPAVPTINASGPTTFCQGGSVTLTSGSATGNLWSNNATTQSITVNATGNYSVTVNNANNCSSTSAPTTVTVNPLPSVTLGSFADVCSTDAVFTLSGGSPAGGTYSGTGVSNGQFNPAVAGVGSFNITYTYSNANNCTSSATKIIKVNNCGGCTPTISASGPTTFCQGGSVTLTASTGSNYLWSTGATSASITVNATGNYSVTVTNANNCTATSAPTTVTVNPLPAVPTINASGPTTFCQGGSVTLTSSSATGNLWSNNATTQSITVNTTGNYTVTVTNANGCTRISGLISVKVNPLPAVPTINASGPTTFCQGGSVTLTSSSATGNLWSNNATTQSITVNASGNYSVTVTNANNCSSTSAPTTVTVNPLPAVPTINASGPTTFCQGGSVTLTSSSATGNLWSNNATTQSITVNTSGNYSVTVTNSDGCSRTSVPTSVTVNNCGGVYCTSSGGSKNKGFIFNVYLRNIFNTTGWSIGGYGNYLNQSASVNRGSGYLISITPGFYSFYSASGLYTKVWIDWNQDNDFDDAGELVFAPVSSSYFLRVGVVNVPNGALSGQTRMRIAMRADASPTSCGSFAYGEVEDYTIVVGGITATRSAEPEVKDEITLQESFNLYPNPVTEELVIQRLSSDNSQVVATTTAMQIIDMNGRVVVTKNLSRSTEVIDVRRLTAGIYFVRLQSGKTITTKKIIVVH